MKAVISTTYSDTYLYFLPISVFCWNKLNVDVICFMPYSDYLGSEAVNQVPAQIIRDTINRNNLKCELHYFNAPKHKEATYAQCLRNYASCLDLPEDEVLITSDVDMAMFSIPPYNGGFTVLGADLVPEGQYPICFVSAMVKDWRNAFDLNGITYQQAIDRLLGDDECQDYRGCRWSVDQEQMRKKIDENATMVSLCNRSNGLNQFAQNRIDRDDVNWRAYLNKDLIDAHLWRPGYTDENFANIMELLTTMYPNDNFDWLIEYRNEFLKLI